VALIQYIRFNKGLTFIMPLLTGGTVFACKVCTVRLNDISLTQNSIEMKKLMIIVALAVVANVGFGQTTTPPPADLASIDWVASTHDFGKIKQGVPASFEFKFTNKGKAPLVITNAQPSCGCTTPSWTHEPVMPGGEGHVKATYNAANPGAFDKTITVTANIEGGVVVLHIKGEVEVAAPVVKPN
jgi:hypothetical protein